MSQFQFNNESLTVLVIISIFQDTYSWSPIIPKDIDRDVYYQLVIHHVWLLWWINIFLLYSVSSMISLSFGLDSKYLEIFYGSSDIFIFCIVTIFIGWIYQKNIEIESCVILRDSQTTISIYASDKTLLSFN